MHFQKDTNCTILAMSYCVIFFRLSLRNLLVQLVEVCISLKWPFFMIWRTLQTLNDWLTAAAPAAVEVNSSSRSDTIRRLWRKYVSIYNNPSLAQLNTSLVELQLCFAWRNTSLSQLNHISAQLNTSLVQLNPCLEQIHPSFAVLCTVCTFHDHK